MSSSADDDNDLIDDDDDEIDDFNKISYLLYALVAITKCAFHV